MFDMLVHFFPFMCGCFFAFVQWWWGAAGLALAQGDAGRTNGSFGINASSICLGAVTLTTLLRCRFSVLLCLYNLCTDTFLMNYPLWVHSANTFPSINPIHCFTFRAESVTASKYLRCSTDHEQKVVLNLLKDKQHSRHFAHF